MAYSSTRMNTSDQVRLYVGDISTSTSSELLADTDYAHFVSVTGNIFIAAQLAANSLAARAASSDSAGVSRKKVGDLEIEYSAGLQDAQTYRDLAKKFGRMAAAGISPYAGGLTNSDKQANRSDTDLVKPYFRRGQFDNPGVLSESLST